MRLERLPCLRMLQLQFSRCKEVALWVSPASRKEALRGVVRAVFLVYNATKRTVAISLLSRCKAAWLSTDPTVYAHRCSLCLLSGKDKPKPSEH